MTPTQTTLAKLAFDTIPLLKYPGMQFEFGLTGGSVYIQVAADWIDLATGAPKIYRGRKFFLMKETTPFEVARVAMVAVREVNEHSTHELFTFEDEPLFRRA